MRYRIVKDSFSGREVQYLDGKIWTQCGSGGHVKKTYNYDVNTFNSHMSATIFMALHDMNCQRNIICEELDEAVQEYNNS